MQIDSGLKPQILFLVSRQVSYLQSLSFLWNWLLDWLLDIKWNKTMVLEQLRSIKQTTLSTVFCAAGDDIDNIQKYILLRPRATALESLGWGFLSLKVFLLTFYNFINEHCLFCNINCFMIKCSFFYFRTGSTLEDLYQHSHVYRNEPNMEGRCSSLPQINFNLWRENLGKSPKTHSFYNQISNRL